MPWSANRDRTQDAAYSTPQYRAAREHARQLADGHCAQCHHPHNRLQCDHIIPRSKGGGDHPANLQMLCHGPGTCQCHERKTAGEGGGNRVTRPEDPEPQPRTNWEGGVG